MTAAGFERVIQARETLQTHALNRAATGIWTILLKQIGVLMMPAPTFHSVLIAARLLT